MSKEESETARERIYMIYDSLQLGAEFSDMADRYSDDQSSGRKGGVLPWFSSGQMIPAFDSTAFALEQTGDISEPVKSDYGWHLIKLLDRKTVGSYEEEKPEIINNIKKGDRGKSKDRAFINKLKESYGYEFYEDNYYTFISTLDTTVFAAEWTTDKASEYFDLPLFTIGEKTVTVEDFANHFKTKQLKRKPVDYSILVGPLYTAFEEARILAYEENRLEDKYPEFRNIVQEYHDGILLFDLTDQLVWSKAVEDTAGLEAFYEENRNNYMWEDRAHTYTIIVKDSTLAKDVIKYTRKRAKRNRFDSEKLMDKFCKDDTTGNCLEVTENKYEKGDNERVDEMKWKAGSVKTYSHNGDKAITLIADILKPSIKKLEDTRGLVIADYQKYLENQWLDELRKKYAIQVNRELLSKIKD
jgi:peptidyl-prolyl cis-trans isomerase SurA